MGIVEKGSARGGRRAWTFQRCFIHRLFYCDIRLFYISVIRNEETKPELTMEDDQQFCLRWNNHQSTLIQNFDTLLESGTLVDCTLAAEGKTLKAHKVVLSACSPYFECLLSEHYDKHPVFILKDVKFKELKAMMDYMYRGEVNISQDQLAALLKAAESLQIKGLSESKTAGSSKTESRPQKTVSQPTAPSLDIPHASSGLTIEKNKVPRQSLAPSSVGDIPEDSASPQVSKGLSSREGSQSPTSRKRKRPRRRSLTEETIENQDASNSSDMPQQMGVPALGIAPVADEKVHADPTDSLGRSALMTQLTKPADEMLQLPLEKPEPNDNLIEPKSEYLDDAEEGVEDLTLDEDMNDLNDMEQDNNRAGPSHDPAQHPAGLGSWHVTGDRSNAGGVVGSVVAGAPGTTDEVFLQAQEAAQAHRDSQGPQVSNVWSLSSHEFTDTENPLDVNSLNNSVMLPSSAPNYSTNDPKIQQSFTCDICGNVYKRLKSLRRHKLHCGPIFNCKFCGLKFYVKKTLNRHMICHNVDPSKRKIFKCYLCGNEFTLLRSLRRHQLQCGNNEQKFNCIFCAKKFNRRDTFHQHMAKHKKHTAALDLPKDNPNEQQIFTCDSCGNKYTLLLSLRRHQSRCRNNK